MPRYEIDEEENYNPFPDLEPELEPWDFQERYEEYLDRQDKIKENKDG